MRSDHQSATIIDPFQLTVATPPVGTASVSALRAWIRTPPWIWVGALLLAWWGWYSVNPVLTPFAVLLLPLFFKLLWRQGEPPVLFFACVMQWFQAALAIFYANYYSIPLDRYSAPELVEATRLSLVGVLVLAVGMRLAVIRTPASTGPAALVDAHRVSIPRLFNAYLVILVFLSAVQVVGRAFPGLRQPLLALSTLQSVAVFMLLYAVLAQRQHFGLLVIVVLFEFATGLLAFFAGFKEIFFILAVVIMASPLALRPARLAIVGGLIAMAIGVGVVWSAIKSEYRDFLNGGSGEQVVVVSVGERGAKLQDLVTDLTWSKLEEGLEMTILRMSYVEYFALTIMNVPDSVPHENGALWLGALEHCFKPRLLFPDKPGISDSERTAKYTGLAVAGEEEGTSIGIGYMGESYIDFGPLGMFAPVLFLGLFFGLIYRFFIGRARYKLLGTAIAASILVFGACAIETSNIKIVGRNVTVLLVMSLLYFGFARPITQWLTRR